MEEERHDCSRVGEAFVSTVNEGGRKREMGER